MIEDGGLPTLDCSITGDGGVGATQALHAELRSDRTRPLLLHEIVSDQSL